MKLQTTIEFMILITASASLLLAAIGAYMHITNSQQTILSAVSNSDMSNANNIELNSSEHGVIISAFAPSSILVGVPATINVVLSISQGYTVKTISLNNIDDATEYPRSYSNLTNPGISILQFHIMTSIPGEHTFDVTALYANATLKRNDTINVSIFASGINASVTTSTTTIETTPLVGKITSRNESITYNISENTTIYSIKEWSHCSYKDFFYHQLPIHAQCGNANWYFWAFSDSCYWSHGITSATYCIALEPSGSSYSSIDGQQNYSYTFNMSFNESGTAIYSILSSITASSPVLIANGVSLGNASVTAVSGIGPSLSESYGIMETSKSRYPIQKSAYDSYFQALSSISSTMSYYNNSGIDQSTLGTISDDIGTFNAESSKFIDTPQTSIPSCSVKPKNAIDCKPLTSFYYNINVAVGNYVPSQTLNIDGSTVYIT